MEDDLDTPAASKVIMNFSKELEAAAKEGYAVREAQQGLREMSRVFGLHRGGNLEEHVVEGWNEHLNSYY